jgi:hypothetical protein
MYQVELVTAPITLVGERKSVLLYELPGFTNLFLPATEFWQTEYYLSRLQVLKPLIIDMAYPLMPQVDIRLVSLSLRKQSGVGAITGTVEDEHPPVSVALRNKPASIFNEGSEVRKPNLHPLVKDLSD